MCACPRRFGPARTCHTRARPLHYPGMASPEQFQLEDGGRIAYEEYGDPQGTPVIFCHGWPSSQTMAQITEPAARAYGIRVISPDRPGVNASSFRAERTLLEWPAVVEQLAAHLSLGKFRVLGVSGGAP